MFDKKKQRPKFVNLVSLIAGLTTAVLILSMQPHTSASLPNACIDTSVLFYSRHICHTYYNNASLPDDTPNHRFTWPSGYTPTCSLGCPATGPGSYAENFINFVANGTPGVSLGLHGCDNSVTRNFQSTADCPPDPTYNNPGVTYSTVVGNSMIINVMLNYDGSYFTTCGAAGNVRIACAIRQAESSPIFTRWKNIVNTYAAAGKITWNKLITGPSPTNPGGPLANCNPNGSGQFTGRTDTVEARYPASAPTIWDTWVGCNYDGVTLPYLVFNNTDGTFFRINLTCGNLTGPLESPPKLTGFINTPKSTITTNDEEAPTSGIFTSKVTSNETNQTDTVTHRFYWLEATESLATKHNLVTVPASDAYAAVSGLTLTTTPYTFTRTIPLDSTHLGGYVLKPGDLICTDTIVAPATGDVDFSNNIVSIDDPSESSTDCEPVVVKPYIEVYGGDVFAGGGIKNDLDPCTPNNNANIHTLTDNGTVNGTKGSGTEFATFVTGSSFTSTGFSALGHGFASAKLLDNTFVADPPKPSPPTDLIFANIKADGTAITPPSNFEGTGTSSCNDNYKYKALGQTISSPASFDMTTLSSNPANNGTWWSGTGINVTVTAGSIANGSNLLIYVDGNLFIKSNITYAGSAGWANAGQIPSVTFIVKGSIYVDHSVTTLDGNYIAEYDSASPNNSGIIYTCTNVAAANKNYDETDLYANCNTQLNIHGALMADHVKWQRAYGSLNKATNPELPVYNGGSPKASEVIIFGPEDYITPSITNSVGPIQSITNLPPIL